MKHIVHKLAFVAVVIGLLGLGIYTNRNQLTNPTTNAVSAAALRVAL